MLIGNWGAAWALAGLVGIIAIGFLFSDTEHHNNNHTYSESAHNQATINDKFTASFIAVGKWAAANRETIEAVTAIGSVIFSLALVFFTGVLAAKTSGLYQATVGLRDVANQQRSDMLRSIAATEKAAAAAEMAMTDLERPWLFLDGVHVRRRDINSPNSWLIKLKWNNVGRSPAIIQDCIFEVVSKNIVALTPNYEKCTDRVRCRKTLPAGDDFFTAEIGLDPPGWKDIEMVIYGKLLYTSIGGRACSSGFALEIAMYGETFGLFDGDEYNYYT
jgi:hypothetical protein